MASEPQPASANKEFLLVDVCATAGAQSTANNNNSINYETVY